MAFETIGQAGRASLGRSRAPRRTQDRPACRRRCRSCGTGAAAGWPAGRSCIGLAYIELRSGAGQTTSVPSSGHRATPLAD